ncbi:MAG: 4Fe-4S dicluster domain-containing protein [Deltaproteobacteria bacterium]|nr:4Fe-4S dicluster domain-containing protein [Deltaproteobacteria bacterium]
MKNKLTLNRRRFLKTAGATAVVGTSGLLGATGKANAGEGKLATLIDLSRCNGCADRAIPACVSACKTIQQGQVPEPVDPIPVPFPTRKVEDWSKKRDVANRLTPYNRIFVQKAEVEIDGHKRNVFIPRRCMHCDNPACATICPFASNHKFENGAVVIDHDTCFGGAKCRTVCPWEIPQRQSGVGIYLKVLPTLMGNGIMVKCDFCNDLLKKGEKPACIEACPQQALAIGPRGEIFAKAEALAAKTGGYLYGKTENGGTSTLYVSPVPFETLDASLKPGPGRPGLRPVKRRMAETDNLGKAVLAAPVLGVAAGVAGAFAFISRRKTGPGKGE